MAKLKKINIAGFQVINDKAPVVIDLGELSGNFINLTGDQELGKSSTLNGIMYLMGVNLKLDNKYLVNTETNKLAGTMEFEEDDTNYRVRCTKSLFTLEAEAKIGNDVEWVERKSPKSILHKIFRTGVVPLDLRYKNGAEQILWFAELFPLEDGAKEIIDGATKSLKDYIEQRRDLSREMKKMDGALKINPTYITWQEKQEDFVGKIEEIRANKFNDEKYYELIDKQTSFEKEKTTLQIYKDEVSKEEAKIKELEAQLAESKERVKRGKIAIEKQEGVVKSFDGLSSEIEMLKLAKENAEVDKMAVQAYDDMIKLNNEYEACVDRYANIDSSIITLKKGILEARESQIPKIEDIDIVMDCFGTEEDGHKDVGIYYKNHPLPTLSGSAFMQCVIAILKASGCRYIFLDEISTYGSEATQYLMELAEELKETNGYIFAAEMKRGEVFSISTK